MPTGVSRTRWQLISSVTTYPAFQDRFVPAEGRHENIGGNFPCSGGHGNLARKARNKAISFVNLDQPLAAVLAIEAMEAATEQG
jgi:hypothetical protein